MTHPAINPELEIAAARLAFPELLWRFDEVEQVFCGPLTLIEDGERVIRDKVYFLPRSRPADAWALERALKEINNGWWSFSKNVVQYQAISARQYGVIFDDTDTLLLLKCVSAMTGLPLHANQTENKP